MSYTEKTEVENGNGHAYIVTYDYAADCIAIDDSDGREVYFCQEHEASAFREEFEKIQELELSDPGKYWLYYWLSQYDMGE